MSVHLTSPSGSAKAEGPHGPIPLPSIDRGGSPQIDRGEFLGPNFALSISSMDLPLVDDPSETTYLHVSSLSYFAAGDLA